MGKQSKRQRASAHAEVPMVPETTVCCLPHCEERGHKLLCGHALCTMDCLKLTKFSDQIVEMIISCPMCRKLEILDERFVSKLVDELPFKCAVFKCYCSCPDCKSFTTAILRPCRSHGNHLCQVCPGGTGAHLHTITRGEHKEETRAEAQAVTLDFTIPGWGLSDEMFELMLHTYRREDNLSEFTEQGLREARRQGREGPPPGR